MRRLASRLLFILCLVTMAPACASGTMQVAVSGHVVAEGTGAPLADQEVELWILKLPVLPIGMGSFVKTSTVVRTDAAGSFALTAEVPKGRRFQLVTRNRGLVYGGGQILLEPASSITDVTISHVLPFKAESIRPSEQTH
jgi:hypothetical protein